jgi:CSLREA domain-containing protein
MRAMLVTVTTAAFVLALMTATANAWLTYTVNTLDDSNGNGNCSLRDAIKAANGTPTAGSTCTTAGHAHDTIQFSVKGTITLTSTLPEITDANLTINGPASPGITISGGDAVRVMQVASGATLNLINLTIAHGNSGADSEGGGIYNSGTLTVTNSIFSKNIASACVAGTGASGGAIRNEGMLTIKNSTFSQNVADVGGAIGNGSARPGDSSSGTVVIVGSTFSHDGADFAGGAIFGGIVTVSNSTFSGSSAQSGGAISGSFRLTVTSSTFSNSGAVDGGAILNGPVFVFCSGAAASATIARGASATNLFRLTVSQSTFSSNNAFEFGGAIQNLDALTVINSTFSGNSAAEGGGIYNYDTGRVTVTNSTLSGSSAPSGSGIKNFGGIDVKSTILAAGSGDNCSSERAGTITDAGYNISDDASCGFAKTGSANNGDNINPLLSTAGLANNGGPTKTIALQSGSPAIDAIPLAQCTDQASPPIPLTDDQRLYPRPDICEAVCDIGAYEFQDTSMTCLTPTLRIQTKTGVLSLSGQFALGASVNPVTQPVTFSVGSYLVKLAPGSFVWKTSRYDYEKTVNGIYLHMVIHSTGTLGEYVLLAHRVGGTLAETTNPLPVTLTIGSNSDTNQMNAMFF